MTVRNHRLSLIGKEVYQIMHLPIELLRCHFAGNSNFKLPAGILKNVLARQWVALDSAIVG